MTVKTHHQAPNSIRNSVVNRDRERQFNRQVWGELVRAEFISSLTTGDDGISSFVRRVEAFSQACRDALDLPFMISVGAQVIAAEIVRRFGSEQLRKRHLHDIASGRSITAIANVEVGVGTNLRRMRSEFVPGAIADGRGTLTITKTPATNAGQAELALCSVSHVLGNDKPSIAVVLVEVSPEDQRELTATMAGFWTGLTGSICTKRTEVVLSEIRLGDERSGGKILRFCYDLERLLLGAAVGGFLKGLTELALKHICTEQPSGVTLHDKQFIQDKVIELHVSATKLEYLVRGTMMLLKDDLFVSLAMVQDPLAAIKLTITDEGRRAVHAFHEIFGSSAFGLDHIAQKSVRDFMALQFLGGTAEQQKMLLFDHLLKTYELTPHRC